MASLFGLFRRKGKEKAKAKAKALSRDPIAAFDALLEQLDRQGSEVRKSAAALLASRGELQRSQERYARQREEIGQRIQTAGERGDGKAEKVLKQDMDQVEAKARQTEEALEKVAADAELVLELARSLGEQSAALRDERNSARARLDAESLLTGALTERAARIEQVLAVDAARDELERAHALAEIVREDALEDAALPPGTPDRVR
ncbi:MAG TPA: hypothetical protein VFA20_18885 [Myxococcaceae bacterium]|nr:hypothetical protein [Myxococcaceae bacterium]